MKFQKRVGNYMVVINASDDQREQVASLFAKLSELNRKGPALKDGTIIKFGWSNLKLSLTGSELAVMEPDFRGNPFQDYIPQVTDTVWVLTEQVSLLQRIEVQGVPAFYNEKVLLKKGCLDKKNIYLQRIDTDDTEDSGWYIGETETEAIGTDEEDIEALYVFQLFRLRPGLMKVLALPVNYIVVFTGDEIEAILDKDDKNIWVN